MQDGQGLEEQIPASHFSVHQLRPRRNWVCPVSEVFKEGYHLAHCRVFSGLLTCILLSGALRGNSRLLRGCNFRDDLHRNHCAEVGCHYSSILSFKSLVLFGISCPEHYAPLPADFVLDTLMFVSASCSVRASLGVIMTGLLLGHVCQQTWTHCVATIGEGKAFRL